MEQIKIPEAPWGSNLQFPPGVADSIRSLITLQKELLSFLRDDTRINITNNQVTLVNSSIFKWRNQNKKILLQYFLQNVRGFAFEICEKIGTAGFHATDQAFDFVRLVGQMWHQQKEFIFWMGFFFKCVYEISDAYQLYSQAMSIFQEIFVTPQQIEDLYAAVVQVLLDERENDRLFNENLQRAVQVFQVLGIDKLNLTQDRDTQLLDQIFYEDGTAQGNEDPRSLRNPFYQLSFEDRYKADLVHYFKIKALSMKEFDTPLYVDAAIELLQHEDTLLNRYVSFSKRDILDAIEQILILDEAEELIIKKSTSLMQMIVQKKHDQISQLYKLIKRIPLRKKTILREVLIEKQNAARTLVINKEQQGLVQREKELHQRLTEHYNRQRNEGVNYQFNWNQVNLANQEYQSLKNKIEKNKLILKSIEPKNQPKEEEEQKKEVTFIPSKPSGEDSAQKKKEDQMEQVKETKKDEQKGETKKAEDTDTSNKKTDDKQTKKDDKQTKKDEKQAETKKVVVEEKKQTTIAAPPAAVNQYDPNNYYNKANFQPYMRAIPAPIQNLEIFERELKLEMEKKDKMKEEKVELDEYEFHPLQYMKKVVFDYVTEKCTKINTDDETSKSAVKYFTSMIELQDEVDQIINEDTKKDLIVSQARDDAFQKCLNEFEASPAFLSQFCDNIFSKDPAKNVSDEEFEKYINHICNFLYYINSKDTFFMYYEKHFASRLLNSRVASKEVELKVISNFKRDFGSTFTKKLEHMFGDIDAQEEINTKFRDWMENTSSYKLTLQDFNFKILQASSWPLNNTVLNEDGGQKKNANTLVYIPDTLKNNTNAFESFYSSNYGNRNIAWQLSEGEAEISFNKHVFVLSTYQSIVVLEFNKSVSIPLKELKNVTQIAPQEVDRIIKMFLKLKLFSVEPALSGDSAKLDDNTHVIVLNEKFTHQRKKLNLNVKKSAEDGPVVTNDEVTQMRLFQLDAIIVKVMKARKIIDFNSIIEEVIKMCTVFQPDLKLIQTQIESLIEREYIKRVQGNRNQLEYIP